MPFNIPTDYIIPDERIVITITEAEEGTASGWNAATSSGGLQASGANVGDGQWLSATAIMNDPGNYEVDQPTWNVAAGEGSSSSAPQSGWNDDTFGSTGKAEPAW